MNDPCRTPSSPVQHVTSRGDNLRLLLVEDDKELQQGLKSTLSQRGDIVEACGDGHEALFLVQSEPWDAVVLDLNLPGMDGLSILKEIRKNEVTVPVLVLSARDSWKDVVTGLRDGADDYMSKPFVPEELIARIEALVRRSSGRAQAEIVIGDLSIDPAQKSVTYKGRDVPLTAFEFRALEHLCRNAGSVISQENLIQHIYSQDTDLSSNVIEVLVARIRKKISPKVIRTVRGHGYSVPDDL